MHMCKKAEEKLPRKKRSIMEEKRVRKRKVGTEGGDAEYTTHTHTHTHTHA